MSNTDCNTTTPIDDLSYRLNTASLNLTYAKSLTGLVADEAACSGDCLNKEERILALCHSLEALIEKASQIIEDVDLQMLGMKS